MTIEQLRKREATAAFERGWRVIPLQGKRPTLPGWQNAEMPSHERVLEWAAAGNYGVVTGPDSGLVVVDVDDRAAAERALGTLPPTVTVFTGKGAHFYFRAPDPCPGNKVGLWPGIDLRGAGGQVVGAGSTHPETRELYRWAPGRSPDEVELAALPEVILERLRPAPVKGLPGEVPVQAAGTELAENQRHYAARALQAELERVAGAPEGERNHTLNQAAFSLGQLVAGGLLDEGTVAQVLVGAAEHAGLGREESWKTVRSGIKAGEGHPRRPAPSGPLTFHGNGVTVTYGAQEEPEESGGPIEYSDLGSPSLVPVRPVFLVPDLIRKEGMHLIWAQPGGYKTRLTLRMLLDLMTAGEDSFLLGHPELPIRRKIERVLIVTTEEDAGELKYIMNTIAHGAGRAFPNGERLVHAYAHQRSRPQLTVDDLTEMVEERGPFDVIVLDSLTGLRPKQVSGRNVQWDKDNDAANVMCLALRRQIAFHKTSLWVIHHSDKLVQNYRGPTEWWASTDIMFGLLRDREHEGNPVIQLKPQKSRGGAVRKSFRVQATWVKLDSGDMSLGLEYLRLPDMSDGAAELYEFLCSNGPTVRKLAQTHLARSRPTIDKYAAELRKLERIEIDLGANGEVTYQAIAPMMEE